MGGEWGKYKHSEYSVLRVEKAKQLFQCERREIVRAYGPTGTLNQCRLVP